MRINMNIPAIIANNQLSKVQGNLQNSLARLSSGYKINHASDDPAGMAISQKMRSQLKGLAQASNNASDAVSVIQTAEGGISEIQSMLTRMKELTVQAANDVNSEEERASIQKEIDSLNNEIDRISNDTEFNTQPLINGNLSRRVFSDTREVRQISCTDEMSAGYYGVTVTQDARQAVYTGEAITEDGFIDGKVPKSMEGKIDINGYSVLIQEGDDISSISDKLIDAAGKIDASVFRVDDTTDTGSNDPTKAGYKPSETYTKGVTSFVFMSNQYGSDETLNITCNNASLAEALGISQTADEDGITRSGLDVKADFTTEPDGSRKGFDDTAVISTKGRRITVNDLNSKNMVFEVGGITAGTKFDDRGNSSVVTSASSKEITQEVTELGMMSVHVGANKNQTISVEIPEITTQTIGTYSINVMNQINASKAITTVDQAIARVSAVRSKLGAYQNRLDHTTSNLAVSDENLTASLSRIIDTDMAEEMTNYTQANVLSQAATSMLSQANARPETVLQLLQK